MNIFRFVTLGGFLLNIQSPDKSPAPSEFSEGMSRPNSDIYEVQELDWPEVSVIFNPKGPGYYEFYKSREMIARISVNKQEVLGKIQEFVERVPADIKEMFDNIKFVHDQEENVTFVDKFGNFLTLPFFKYSFEARSDKNSGFKLYLHGEYVGNLDSNLDLQSNTMGWQSGKAELMRVDNGGLLILTVKELAEVPPIPFVIRTL